MNKNMNTERELSHLPESVEASLEKRFSEALINTTKEIKGRHLSALFEIANISNKNHRGERGQGKEGEKVIPRRIGKDFKETFANKGSDGIDGRIETIKLEEGERAFMMTDLHGDEESAKQAFSKVIEVTINCENKIHFINLGDFAVQEDEESIEPLKMFLAMEALKKIDLEKEEVEKPEGEEQSLPDFLKESLLELGISEEELASVLDKVKSNLEIHSLSGNGEMYLPPMKQIEDQMGRKINVLGVPRARKFLENLPLSLMMRTKGKDIFASHFLPPLVKERAWKEKGLAAINDEKISDLTIEAGVWGGFDKNINAESIKKKAEERGVSPDELWDLGRLTMSKGRVGGIHILKEKRITFSGIPTFQRVLSTKEQSKGAYFFGHEAGLSAKEEKGYYSDVSKDGNDEVISFHTGYRDDVPQKMMMEIDSQGKIIPIRLNQEQK